MQAQIRALEAGANKDDADAKNKEQDRLLKEQQTLKLSKSFFFLIESLQFHQLDIFE